MRVRDEFRLAFDPIVADESLKQKTRQRVESALSHRRPRMRRRVLIGAACALLFLVIGGYRLLFATSAVISIDINPSLELRVNRFDRVIGAEGFNSDGEELLRTLSLFYRPYEQAVTEVLGSEAVSSCLAEDELLEVTIVHGSPAQGQRLLDGISDLLSDTPNATCCAVNQDEVAQAHTLGLSYGKYRVYLELHSLLPDLTPQQVAGLTMRELRQLLADQANEAGAGGVGGPAAAPGKGLGNPFRGQGGAKRENKSESAG